MRNRSKYEEALSKGHSYSWDQRWDDAIMSFQIAVDYGDKQPAPYAGLGMAYFAQGNFKDALVNYKQAARYSRGDVIYLRQVADMQERLGITNDASQTYMAIGEIEFRNGVLDQALENWSRAVRLEPNLMGAHQRLAKFYTKQKQVRAAIREYLSMARIFQSRGERGKALQTCKAALSLDPRNADVLTAIELIQHGESLAEDAGELDELSSLSGLAGDKGLDPGREAESSPVKNAQRMALEQLAEQIFGEEGDSGVGKLSKLERDALISQALDHQTRGQVNEAIRFYEQAIAGGVTSTAAHFNLGLLYQDKLRFEEAIREFKIAVQDHEYRLGSHYALGESYRARGQIDTAVEHFITVLKIVDLSTVQHDQADRLIHLYSHLADSLQTKGEHEQASGFANALVEFLSHKGWEDKVKEARARLDALSGDRMMILGDILTIGSEHVLESLYLSQEYEKRDMLNTAIEEVYRAISHSPVYLPAHIRLAELLAKQGRTEAAISKFVMIGDSFRIRSDTNSAITMYERVADLAPLDFSIRARLVDLLKRHGQIDRALVHYKSMGESYYQLAQVDKARETYQAGLKLAPRGSADKKWRAQFLNQVAEIDMQRFAWRRALTAYKELRREDPANERVAITLIDLYYRVKQPGLALRELDFYLKQLVQSGRGAKVVGILEDMASRHPTDPGIVERLSRLYLAQKRSSEAVTLLDKLGEAQLDAGQKKEAMRTIQRIVRLNPSNVTSYHQLLNQIKTSL